MLTPTDAYARALLKQSRRASCLSIAQAMPYVRNVRTHVTTTHLSSYLTLGNARRGAARFPLNMAAAGAARGRTAAR